MVDAGKNASSSPLQNYEEIVLGRLKTGRLTRQHLEEVMDDIGDTVIETGSTLVLLDCSQMHGYELSARHAFVDWNAKFRHRVTRVGIVIENRPYRAVISAMGFASGQEMKGFADHEEARAWLLSVPKGPLGAPSPRSPRTGGLWGKDNRAISSMTPSPALGDVNRDVETQTNIRSKPYAQSALEDYEADATIDALIAGVKHNAGYSSSVASPRRVLGSKRVPFARRNLRSKDKSVTDLADEEVDAAIDALLAGASNCLEDEHGGLDDDGLNSSSGMPRDRIDRLRGWARQVGRGV